MNSNKQKEREREKKQKENDWKNIFYIPDSSIAILLAIQ